MKNSLRLLAVLVVFSLGLAAPVMGAKPERPQRGPQRPPQARTNDPLARLVTSMQKLDLSAEQKKDVAKIAEEGKKKLAQAQTAHREAMRELNKAAQQVDEQAIMAAAKTVGSALGIMTVQRVKLMAKLRSVLTPEQQEGLKKQMRRPRPQGQEKDRPQTAPKKAPKEKKTKAKKDKN